MTALVATSLMAEGAGLHPDCPFVIHHDLRWNPSKLGEQTGRGDRIDAKAKHIKEPIHVFVPRVARARDQRMYRVVRDRGRWFHLMEEDYIRGDEATQSHLRRLPLPDAAAARLMLRLGHRQ